MANWQKSNYPGLRYREHDIKTTGVGRSKRPLRYYMMTYKFNGKVISEALGWEGPKLNEEIAYKLCHELKLNRKNKTPPFTFKELQEDRQKELDKVEETKRKKREEIERLEKTKFDAIFGNYCADNTHKKSLRDEKNYYKNWIKAPLGQKRLDEIVLLDLDRIRKKMTEAGKAPRSIQYIKSIVRQTYNYAIERSKYSGPLPTDHFLKKQKIDNNRQRYLSSEEARGLLEEIRKKSLNTYRVSLLSLNSGMRFGEIASLQWQHIDDDNRSILIIDPKNGESRSAFMTDVVVSMFKDMKRGKPQAIVFPSTTGKKMDRISNTFTKAVKTLGLNEGITDPRMKVVFHTLRHSCASWLVNAGVELPTIAKILGHKNLTMTMRYSHINDTSVQGAMKLLDQQQESMANGSTSRKLQNQT